MLPPPSISEEAKPKITDVQEEEEVDMTEIVYPIKPDPPSDPVVPFILAGGLVIVSGTCGFNEVYKWEPDLQRVAVCGTLCLIGIVALLMVFKIMSERKRKYMNSEEMQEYMKEKRAAVDKSWAQFKRRTLQKK